MSDSRLSGPYDNIYAHDDDNDHGLKYSNDNDDKDGHDYNHSGDYNGDWDGLESRGWLRWWVGDDYDYIGDHDNKDYDNLAGPDDNE